MDHDFVGLHASAGCLDLAVERRPDDARGPVLAYAFGNRCGHPALVDLANAVVVARSGNTMVRLRPFDPQREIVPREIDSRAVGGEAIAYLADARASELCVDAASIAQPVDPRPRWLCLPRVTAVETVAAAAAVDSEVP